MDLSAADRPTLRTTLPVTLLGAMLALLGPVAGLAPRGMPAWALGVLALSALLLVRGGLGPVRPAPWTAGVVATFLALAATSIAWSPSPRAGLTVVEIGYVVLTAGLAWAWIAQSPAETAERLGRLFVGGLLLGILLFAIEEALDHPLHRWVNGVPWSVRLSTSNVPKRAAALLALLVWPAALVLWRRGYGRMALGLPVAFAVLSALQSSRSAMAGVVVGLAVFALAYRRATAARRTLGVVLTAAFAGAIPLAHLLDRTLDLSHAEWLFRSARHRVEIWTRAADRAMEAPLFGQGIDASRALAPMGETSQFETLTTSLLPLHPHNSFLQIWLELGATGAALGLAAGLLLLGATRRLAPEDQPYALAGFAAALAMASAAYGLWQAWWMAGMLAAGLTMALAGCVPRRSA